MRPLEFDHSSRSMRLLIVLLFAALGLLAGGAILGLLLRFPKFATNPSHRQAYPLPHHVARYPDNLTFRFAMAHDVLHERFPRHGREYYVERNRKVSLALHEPAPADQAAMDRYFALIDDLAVGLCFTDQHERAVEMMRDKLKRQQALGRRGRDLYSTYANLGTFLILWQLHLGLPGGDDARPRIRESIDWVRKAIEVYPESHFGRERWQLVLEEFLLAVMDRPDLLLKFDMIGNRLGQDTLPKKARPYTDRFRWSGFYATETWVQRTEEEATELRREFITPVGAQGDWQSAVRTSLTQPAPFDEPALGIIGMWRMGAGANPYFSMALGEIMLRVGQRYLAWDAYERTWQMKEHLWPDVVIQRRFGELARERQALIESQLPGVDWDRTRQRVNQELAHGKEYQRAYQAYEAQRIREGASIDDPEFYKAFDQDHAPIATPPGEEESFVIEERRKGAVRLPAMLFFAGLFAVVGVWLTRTRPKAPTAGQPRDI